MLDRMGRDEDNGSAPRRRMRVLAMVLAHKILVFGIIAIIVAGFPESFSRPNSNMNLLWPESARHTWREFFVTWDSSHYLRLAEQGYRAGEMSSAFFPLWPMMIRGTAEATGLSALACALLLSNLLSSAAIVVLFEATRRARGDRVAWGMTALLLSYPSSFTFCLPYTESLFLFLLAIFWSSWREPRGLAVAATAALLLPLCRSVGLLMLAPVTVAAALSRISVRRAFTLGLALIAGYVAYLAFIAWQTGNAWEGFEAQRRFVSTGSIARLFDPLGFAKAFVSAGVLHGFTDSVIDRVAFVAFVAASFTLRRRPVELAAALGLGLVPAVSMHFMSFRRYFGVVMPVFEGVGEALVPRRRSFFLCVIALLAMQAWMVARHVRFEWAG